jgi:citrate lyase subunit beta/citryl-CoA lyase
MRSKLFVPGSRPELFPKALAGAADAISIDLEDAVAPGRKAEARTATSVFLQSPERLASAKVVIVRVNAIETPEFEADLQAVVWPGLGLLNLPKLESADEIRAVAKRLERLERERGITTPTRILANIESPRGLRLAAEIAGADPRVAGLQAGYGDLFGELGIDRTDTRALQQVQLAIRLAAGEAGIWALDGAYAAVNHPDGYREEAVAAKRLGYRGKTCIHPSQVPIANEVFRPTAAQIAAAEKIVAAAAEAEAKGIGAFLVDGRMIDAPFISAARATLAIARQLGP